MPRQYTQRAFLPGNIANVSDINEEISTAATELNGMLDQNNMPINSINDARVADPTVDIEVENIGVNTNVRVVHTYMPSQSYHVSEYYANDYEISSPAPTVFTDSDWRLGWMKLAEKRTTNIGGTNYYAGAELTFPAQEGMIVGELLIDANWRFSFFDYQGLNTAESVTLNEKYIEIGIFVNDVCCARTDWQWLGGRFTFSLPFSTPIGTTAAQIDVRFRVRTDKQILGSEILYNGVAPLRFYDSSIWARNEYR